MLFTKLYLKYRDTKWLKVKKNKQIYMQYPYTWHSLTKVTVAKSVIRLSTGVYK